MGGINCRPVTIVEQSEVRDFIAEYTGHLFAAQAKFAEANQAIESAVIGEMTSPDLARKDILDAVSAFTSCAEKLRAAQQTLVDTEDTWEQACADAGTKEVVVTPYQLFDDVNARQRWVDDGLIPATDEVWSGVLESLRAMGYGGYAQRQRPVVKELETLVIRLSETYTEAETFLDGIGFHRALQELRTPASPITIRAVRVWNDVMQAQGYLCLLSYSATSSAHEGPLDPATFGRTLADNGVMV